MIKISFERWKWNPDFELYVSNKGHFMTRDKRLMPLITNAQGYLSVYCYGIANKAVFAHRAVLLTWRPNADAEHLTVDHIDHNKRNNELSNLEWVSKEENQRRAAADLGLPEEDSEDLFAETKPNKPYVTIDGIVFDKLQYKKIIEIRYTNCKRVKQWLNKPYECPDYCMVGQDGKPIQITSLVYKPADIVVDKNPVT